MIKFSATNALVHSVSPVMQVTDKFQKREIIIDDSWEKDGNRYSNYVCIEFTGEKMAQLDAVFPGQRVTIEGMLTGREYNGRIFNTVKGLSVALYQPQPQQQTGGYAQQQPQYQQPQAYQSAPMPGGYGQGAPAYPQQSATPAYPQQQYPQHTAPAQAYGQPSSPGVADLPFPR